MKIKIKKTEIERDWEEYKIYLGKIEVGIGYLFKKYHIFYLHKIDLRKWNFDKKGYGKKIIYDIYDKFSSEEDGEFVQILVQYPNGKNAESKNFYLHLGFEDFDSHDYYGEDEKADIRFLLDEFCNESNLLILESI